MNALLMCVLLGLAPGAAGSPGRPSVAVSEVTGEVGISEGAARLVTDEVIDVVRRSGAFSRVLTSRDMVAVLGLERQRQLLDCSTESCVAELAGALGVDFILVGTVGRLGELHLLNLRLINARSAEVVAGATHRGRSEDVLVEGVRPAIQQLLREAGLITQAPPPEPQTSSWSAPVRAAGAVLLVGAGVPLLFALVMAGVAAGVVVAPTLVALPTPEPFKGPYRAPFFLGTGAGVGLLSATSLVLAMVFAVLGAGAVTAATVAG
ncbi:MAG: hypothetical protein AB2A00_15075 [Myxococcota bacterium]